MTRKEVRILIRKGVNLMTPTLSFGSGLITDFNSIRSNQYPTVWMGLREVSGTNEPGLIPNDSWKIELIVAKIDKMDSSPEQYEEIIDDCDEIAQKLMYKYNKIVDGYKLLSIADRERKPFVKKYADCLTGVMLSFTLNIPDKTNVC